MAGSSRCLGFGRRTWEFLLFEGQIDPVVTDGDSSEFLSVGGNSKWCLNVPVMGQDILFPHPYILKILSHFVLSCLHFSLTWIRVGHGSVIYHISTAASPQYLRNCDVILNCCCMT